jgi:hypothetical protein
MYEAEHKAETLPGFLRPSSAIPRWIFFMLAGMHHLLAFAPALVVLSLYVLYWQAGVLLGHPPVPYADDPNFIVPGSIRLDILYFLVLFNLIGTCFGLVIVPVLSVVMWKRYARLWSVLLLVAFVLGFVMLRLDPGLDPIWTWFFD